MEQKQKKLLTYILIGILVITSLVGSYFGIKLPAPEIPTMEGTRGTISRTGIIDANGDGLVTWNGGTIATYSDAGSTETFSVTGSTGAFSTDSTISQTQVNAASGSANPYDYTGTLGIMNGSDDFTLFDVNITNANHTGASNTVQALDVAAITGDADATETAIKVGNGWDFGADLGDGGLTTAGQTIIGGGYGSTGATISAAGVGQFNGAITTDGALTADSGAFGGGYGATGASISNAGVGQFNGAVTTDGALTADSAVIGGGYGTTGCTASTAGALSCDGLLTGALGATVTGATVNLNASSNFGVNLATGASSGAVAIGGGSGTVAIDTTTWDVSTAGAVTGIGDITAITGLSGGWDLGIATAAADTTAGTLDVTGQTGGTASADQVGKDGGNVTVTAGAGSAKNGAGANDGNGGDVVLQGGARGGATGGTETYGVVRIGNPTIGSTRAVDLLAVGGGLEVDGAARLDGTLAANSSSTFGGGYGTTGCSISDAGVLQCNGAATTDGALTADSAVIGGGGWATGCTIDSSGNLTCSGTVAGQGALTANTAAITGTLAAGATTLSNDLTLTPDSTGGDAGARVEISGLPRIKMVAVGAGTNGAAVGKTLSLMDDSPAGEWAAHNAHTTCANDAVHYKIGAASLAATFTTAAVAGEGCHDGVAYDFSDDESVGMWVYSSIVLAAGDIVLTETDDGGAHSWNVPAVATASKWTWVEIDISGTANADKDTISDLSLALSAAGAVKAAAAQFVVNFDDAWKWDATEEAALGNAIIQDGVLSVIATVNAGGTPVNLVEGTGYFVHYETGNDFLVWVSDQSANSGIALIAY